MARRSTIGENPLDAVVPISRSPSGSVATDDEATVAKSSSQGVKKERLTVHLPVALIERIKNAVYWTPGATLTGVAEQALGNLVDALEQERGEPFPQRKAELTGGRPYK